MSQENLHILLEGKDIIALAEKLKDSSIDLVAYDTETVSLEKDAEIVGLSIAFGDELDTAYYIVAAYWDKDQKKLIRLDTRKEIIELIKVIKTKQLVMHNALVDCDWTFRNYGIQLIKSLFIDTMVLAHLLDENRPIGLKDLGAQEFGESAKKEQQEMKQSVIDNGGIWEQTYDKKKDIWRDKKGGIKEMYKADYQLMGKYGAKDALLTLKIAMLYIPKLYEEGLDKFFFEESMPLFKGPTYQMNTVGLKIDMKKLEETERSLTLEIANLESDIRTEIYPYIKDLYPGTKPKNTFNLGSSSQVAWLLFIKLDNDWRKLTKGGRAFAKDLMGKVPYTPAQRRQFVRDCLAQNVKPQKYIQCDKATLSDLEGKYAWVKKLLEYKKLGKLLDTYVIGMKKHIRYGVIYPSFNQTGTNGTRYSSSRPNFQNLPRDDKRIKKLVIARPGKSFVGADYSQLEPRVFASFSGDERLMSCFSKGEDFYAVVGIPIFGRYDATPFKEGSPDAFGVKYKEERNLAKGVCLSATYGTGAYKLSEMFKVQSKKDVSPERCQEIIDDYFRAYPKVKEYQLKMHEQIKNEGVVYNLFGRPRRVPEAKIIKSFGKVDASELDYEYRTLLNLGVNSPIQNTAGSIINRAMIAVTEECEKRALEDKKWAEVNIILSVHDEAVLEGPDEIIEEIQILLKDKMINTSKLPGVELDAEPKIAKNLADLK